MKKNMALLLAGMLTLMSLAACSQGGASGSQAAQSPPSGGSSDEPAAETSDKMERISEDGLTWTIFKDSHTIFGTQVDDWNDTMLFQKLEERTGVHLDFITPVLGQAPTQMKLLVSSGDYPDFISGTHGYVGGGEALIHDGVVVDLSQHLSSLPNFSRELSATEFRSKEVYTDSGKIPGLPAFYENDEESEVFVGILLRKDLLDQVGMDVPVTYDDWHTVLTAFKKEAGISKALVPGPEMFAQNNMWSAGYGFGYVDYFGTGIPFYQIDNQIRYAPLDDSEAFRSYLEMMAAWYAEGLLDPDFQSVTDVNTQISTYSSVDCGACVTAYSLAPVLASIASAAKEDFEYMCVPIPVLEPGQTPHMYAGTSRIDLNQLMITTACEELELALRYWDQMYTAEGSLLACWGVEGETFDYDANGDPQWTDYIVANSEYNFVSMRHYALANMMPGVFERRAGMVEPISIASNQLYRENGDNRYRISANVTLTEEENDVYSTYMTDILTYMQEKCIRYITGQESFDSYDKLADELRSMNVEKVMEVYQAALDRYNAR